MTLERFALALAAALTAVGLYLVPSWRGEWLEPCHVALIASALTVLLLVAARSMAPGRAAVIERTVLALFLAGMPAIYLARGGWRGIEVAGLFIYGVCALAGWRRIPWMLAAGIAAHGAAWDSWHYFGSSSYIPSWYSLGCLLVDVGIGLYAAVRVSGSQSTL